jgi:Ankyrin repeats (3 copies)
MHPKKFNAEYKCTSSVDGKKVCSKLMGENEFSLLHIAIFLEKKKKLKKFLRVFNNDLTINQLSGKHHVSAMHIAAQGNYPVGIDLLLKYEADIDLPDSRGFTPLHHAAYRKCTEATLHLISKGAALNTMSYPNVTTLALVLRKTPSAEKAIIQRLDRSITFHSDLVEDKHYLDFDMKQWKMSTGDDQTQSVHDYDLVHVFAKEEQKFKGDQNSDFIKHPLVQKILDDAWTLKVCIMYWAIFIFKFSIMVMMAFYILNGRKPGWLCGCLLGAEILEFLRKFIGIVSFTCGPTSTKLKETLCTYYLFNFQFHCYSIRLIGSFILFSSGDELLLEMCSPMILLAGWLDCILMFGETRVLGLYMDMFYCVLMNFFKILKAFGLFLVGFAICFWLYFHQQNSFAMVILAFTKIIVMFIGELDYNDLIENYLNQNLEMTSRNGTTFKMSPSEAPEWYLIFPLTCICLFVVAVPIVLQGLLIGIVVKDISEIKDKAVAQQLKRNANHLEHVVKSIDSIFWFLKSLPCKLHERHLKARMDDTVRVEFLFENSSQPKYLDAAYEITKRN